MWSEEEVGKWALPGRRHHRDRCVTVGAHNIRGILKTSRKRRRTAALISVCGPTTVCVTFLIWIEATFGERLRFNSAVECGIVR